MATNLEDQSRELTAAMEQAQRDVAALGKISQTTAEQVKDAQMKAKYGMESFSKGTASAAGAVMSLGEAGMSAASAMLAGKKGASAFNSSVDGMAKAAQAAGLALTFLVPGGPIIKALIAGMALAVTAYAEYTKAANDMADKLYDGYRGMAESGAAAADGMEGLFKGAQKLNLSMSQLGEYVQLVSANSRDLANFGGSVYKGRQAFEDIGQAMQPATAGLMKIGLMPKDIAEGMAGYVRTQTRLGNAQKMTVDQMASGVKNYLIEQDALTKLTGVSRKEAEKMREDALMEEQHAGMIRKLQLEGKNEEAKNLMAISDAANRLNPEFGKMVRAAQSGNLSNEAAQKLLMSAPDVFNVLQQGQKGILKPMEVMDRVVKQIGETGDRAGASLAVLGANDQTFVGMGLTTQLRIAQEKGLQKTLDETEAELKRQGTTANSMVAKQVDLMTAQIAATKSVELFIKDGIGPAQDNMIKLAEATAWAAAGLNEMFHNKDPKLTAAQNEKKAASEKTNKAFEGANFLQHLGMGRTTEQEDAIESERKAIESMNKAQLDAGAKQMEPFYKWVSSFFGGGSNSAEPKVEGARAAGGPVDAGKLYKVGERGQEYFKPKVAGDIIPNDVATSMASDQRKLNQLYKELIKDTEDLEKITDIELVRTRDFGKLSKTLMEKKTELVNKELELLNNQRSGPAAGGGMGGGSGLKMPTAGNMPSMGGGQGMQISSQEDLAKMGLNIKSGDVQGQNSKISPKIIELARAIQSGVPGFSYFSSFNDKYHQENAPSSQHTQGLAVDFAVAQPPSIEDGKNITKWLKDMGASVAIDEYNSPSAKATGGHFHAQIPAFEDGGELGAGKIGIAGEAGPELITGPASITPMNELMKAFNGMSGILMQQVNMLDELVRAQKNGNDISTKILRVQT